MSERESCPLCEADAGLFHGDRFRPYYRCQTCDLVHVPRAFHISPAEAKARYDLHQNSAADPGYRAFLERLVNAIVPLLEKGSCGIDFGSGPEPVLSQLMTERGFAMTGYDPFYSADPSALAKTYDFLVCSETVEHFVEPRKSFDLMVRLIRAGGRLGIMTNLVSETTDFERWHYAKDETHVCFYSQHTFRHIARKYGFGAEFYGTSVVLMNA